MSTDLLPMFIREHYEVHEWKHACTILKEDFSREWNNFRFRLWMSFIDILTLYIYGVSSSTDVSSLLDGSSKTSRTADNKSRSDALAIC